MSNYSSHLRQLVVGQSPYAVANASFDASSPAATFGIDIVGTSGLTLSIFGGVVNVGGVSTTLSNQTTLALTASSTNYIEFDKAGTGTTSGIRLNTSGWTAGRVRLYTVTTNTTDITGWTDYRFSPGYELPRQVVNMATDANRTLTAAEADSDIIEVTSASLSTTRNVVVPLVPRMWVVFNNTTGSQSIQFIGATGTGITVANAKRAIIYSDGTNIVRVTADNP